MQLDDLIYELQLIRQQYPGHTRVLADGETVTSTFFVSGGAGCLPFVNIGTKIPSKTHDSWKRYERY